MPTHMISFISRKNMYAAGDKTEYVVFRIFILHQICLVNSNGAKFQRSLNQSMYILYMLNM